MRKINPRNYIPKNRIICKCETCKFMSITGFCKYHQEVVGVTGCSAYKKEG